MDVPVIVSLSPLSANRSIDGAGAESAAAGSSGGFSERLDETVGQLNNKTEPVSKADKLAGEVKGAGSSRKASAVDSEKGQGLRDEAVLDQAAETVGLSSLAVDINTTDQLSDIDGAANIAFVQQVVGEAAAVTIESGKLLPAVENIDVMAELTEGLDLELTGKELSFDPLSQASELPAQVAALVAGHIDRPLPQQGTKNTRMDGANKTMTGLSLNLGVNFEGPQVTVDKLVLPIPTNGIKSSAISPLVNADGALGGLPGGLSPAASQLAVDKPMLALDTPMSNPRWGQDFNQRVQWVVNQSMSGAQIRLNPQHMGPVEVRIQLQNDQATISFTAQHGATREAIDAALPRLREMLSEQNVDVLDVNVSQHSFAEQRDQQASKQQGNQQLTADAEQAEVLFDQASDAQQRVYTGLFSGVA